MEPNERTWMTMAARTLVGCVSTPDEVQRAKDYLAELSPEQLSDALQGALAAVCKELFDLMSTILIEKSLEPKQLSQASMHLRGAHAMLSALNEDFEQASGESRETAQGMMEDLDKLLRRQAALFNNDGEVPEAS